MAQVTVSRKFQVVIPLDVRKNLHIQQGQRLTVFASGGCIALVPDEDIAQMEGVFRGLSLDGLREDDKRDR